MAFRNRIRLPLQLHSAQFPEDRQIFRKANGQTKTMSVVIRKTYELETDFMPEKWHQRLKIAMAHDEVIIEGEKYLGNISQDGDYNIEWPEGVLHYPTAKAAAKVQVTPFDATNSNCQTCEEVSQLSLENDEAQAMYGEPLEEDTDYIVNTADNDRICCYPAVFSLVSFNTTYLTSATINPATGEVSIHTGSDLVSANGIVIATYRVTCPNGAYDEADIIADINGSIVGCLAPSGLEVGSITPESALACWDESTPGTEYYWELYLGTGPVGSPVQTGTLTDTEELLNCVTLSGLTPGEDYYFQVRTTCESSNSNFINASFETPEESESCGQYNINYSDSTFTGPPFVNITYTDCNGDVQNVQVLNNGDRLVCALQNTPGDPVNLSSSNPDVTINYLTLC